MHTNIYICMVYRHEHVCPIAAGATPYLLVPPAAMLGKFCSPLSEYASAFQLSRPPAPLAIPDFRRARHRVQRRKSGIGQLGLIGSALGPPGFRIPSCASGRPMWPPGFRIWLTPLGLMYACIIMICRVGAL